MVLTGGRATGDTKITSVIKYNIQGTATDLPSLNTGRSYHACGKFRKTDGSVVWIGIIDHRIILLTFIMQFYIIAGGQLGTGVYTSSTEILKKNGGTKWQQVANLPSPRTSAGVSLPNGNFIYGLRWVRDDESRNLPTSLSLSSFIHIGAGLYEYKEPQW